MSLMSVANGISGNQWILYHGTSDSNFAPSFDYDNPNNDYGKGLYMTKGLQSAKEWAMSKYNDGTEGYAYEFALDTSGLRIYEFTSKQLLQWVAILLDNRRITCTPLQQTQINTFIKKYLPKDIYEYDIIVGYRADDSYHAYMESYVSGRISEELLEKAMKLNKLGIHYCIKSERAFALLEYNARYKASKADGELFNKKDAHARKQYLQLLRNDTGTTTFFGRIGV